ncbi:MAG: type II toxin-antitoxin system RelE/ParE family toxin [Candidatus Didemnitutus sp.]|nr:type II toxin-antitoxin system RelE/ParE family toxin [Candidatus Didemnitutus sp.]
MSWRVELRPEALAELDEAAAWYEARSAELGRELVREVARAISTLAGAPLVPRLRHRRFGVRWIFSKRFPYRIVYRVESERVVVLAIMHAARSDAVWHGRA